MCRLTVSLLLKNISNNTSLYTDLVYQGLYTDLVDQGLSQLVDSWMGRVILGVGFCSFITVIPTYLSMTDSLASHYPSPIILMHSIALVMPSFRHRPHGMFTHPFYMDLRVQKSTKKLRQPFVSFLPHSRMIAQFFIKGFPLNKIQP